MRPLYQRLRNTALPASRHMTPARLARSRARRHLVRLRQHEAGGPRRDRFLSRTQAPQRTPGSPVSRPPAWAGTQPSLPVSSESRSAASGAPPARTVQGQTSADSPRSRRHQALRRFALIAKHASRARRRVAQREGDREGAHQGRDRGGRLICDKRGQRRVALSNESINKTLVLPGQHPRHRRRARLAREQPSARRATKAEGGASNPAVPRS